MLVEVSENRLLGEPEKLWLTEEGEWNARMPSGKIESLTPAEHEVLMLALFPPETEEEEAVQ